MLDLLFVLGEPCADPKPELVRWHLASSGLVPGYTWAMAGYTQVRPGVPGCARVDPGMPGNAEPRHARVYLGIVWYTCAHPSVPMGLVR